MANELQQILNDIVSDKATNLKPEYLKKGVTLLGVEGTFEGESSRSNIKMFNSKEAMDADEDKQPDDIAILYSYSEVEVASTMTVSGFVLPKELPTSLISSTAQTIFEGGLNDMDRLILDTDGTIRMDIGSVEGSGGSPATLYTKSGDKLVRGTDIGEYFSYTDYRVSTMGQSIVAKWADTIELKVSDTANDIWNYIKPVVYDYFNLYQVKDSSYTMVPTNLTTLPNHIVKGRTALTATGKTTGTLDLSAYSSKKVKFSNAIPGYSISEKKYNGSSLVVALNTSFNYELGDKRFVLFHRQGDGMALQDVDVVGIYDDIDTVIQSSDTGNSFALTPDRVFETGGYCMWNEVSPESIKNCYPVTEFTDNTETFNLFGSSLIMYTNCKVTDKDGNVLKEAGPKASTTLKGQYYINLFGEIVEGTAEATQEVQQQVQELQQTVSTAETLASEIIGEE